MSLDIFIGYDPKEAVAFHVCANSIIRHSSKPVIIHPLALTNLQDYKEGHKDGSNEFIYSRFLVPYLMGWTGKALYVDGDMVVTGDIAELFDLADQYKAVQVVKHDYKTSKEVKYLGQRNEDYPRKNWSSVILWNCGHFAHRQLTPEFIEGSSGEYLHRFTWLKDELIGELPVEWNWLSQEMGANAAAKLIHYTLGLACFEEYKNDSMAETWWKEVEMAIHPCKVAI